MTQEAAHAHMTQEASWLDRAGAGRLAVRLDLAVPGRPDVAG